ncbi:MAG: DUF4157 domain-containing protein [Thermofilaceae archaeon]
MQFACPARKRGRPEPYLFPARVMPDGRVLPGEGRPLPRAVQAVLQPFFSFPLSIVRVHSGIPEWAYQLSSGKDPIAISYKNHIFVKPGYADLLLPSGWRTLIHELRHIEQWYKMGDAFYRDYTQAHQKHGYHGNPYERDAYRHEARVARALGLT